MPNRVFVSEGGKMAKPSSGQMKEFWSQVEAGRITGPNFQEFLTNLDQQAPDEDSLTFKVSVDFSQPLETMIEAGKYGMVDEEVTSKNFPVEGEDPVDEEVVIVQLDRKATTKEVEAELDKRGLRPARIEELLALGAAHHDLQRQYPIVALGSRCVLRGGERVPVLYWKGGLRGLRLHRHRDEWRVDSRFAAVRKDEAPPAFQVTVDYSQPLETMIKTGKYDWVDEKATSKNFPVEGEGQVDVEVILVHFDRYVTTEEVEAEFEKRGLRPARIEELLALGAAHPDLQREYYIVSLGSRCVFGDSERVPVLDRRDGKRVLYLSDYRDRWNERCRRAAVRK